MINSVKIHHISNGETIGYKMAVLEPIKGYNYINTAIS